MQRVPAKSAFFAFAFLTCFPLVAAAQAIIAGQVKDEGGGVLPGVSVEASSPALIERVRTVVTDGEGRYRLIDLRPGMYKVTFTITGFSTLVRDAVEVSASVVATVNADLKVASLEETVTVSGAAPVVDVQQASKTLVLTRDLIDALPTTRNVMSVGQYMPGLRQTIPDVGGSRYMEQTQMFGHGASSRNTTIAIDGLMMNANKADGATQNYYNDQLNAEITMTTSALPAEIQAGGVYVNNIPKDGGNVKSASVFLGETDGAWQSNNINADLIAQGLKSSNSIAHIHNFSGTFGGPIVKDRLWFLTGAGDQSTDERAANAPSFVVLPDGTHFDTTINQFVRNVLARLTTQVTTSNKFSVFFQRSFKSKRIDFTSGTDPYHSSSTRPPLHGNYNMGTAKWTSTLGNRLMIDAGFGTNVVANSITYQPWMFVEKFLPSGVINPAWYAGVGKNSNALMITPDCLLPDGCTVWGTSPADSRSQAWRGVIQSAVSYNTGSHTFKTGINWSFGTRYESAVRIGDLTETYLNGKPSSVTVYNTPNITQDNTPYDLAVFVQDNWVFHRVTVNPGVRIEYFSSYGRAVGVPAGRFRPALDQPKTPGITFKNDVAPRFSMGYDVFGDGKTAIKGSASKYYAPFTGEWGRRYVASVGANESRNWSDCDVIPGTSQCSGVVLPTNGDGIAQDNEIGPSAAGASFGVGGQQSHVANFQKFHNWEYTASIQRQILSGVSVDFGYFRRMYYNLPEDARTLITNADYTPFEVKMPDVSKDPAVAAVLNPNEILTLYNLSSIKRGSYGLALLDFNSTQDKAIYNGLEAGFNARLKNRSMVSFTWSAFKNVQVSCDTHNDPNGQTAANVFGDGALVSVGGRFCDQSQYRIPWRHEFKVLGSVPLPYGIGFAGSIQSYPGLERTITWAPPTSVFPNNSRTNTETIILTAPGQLYAPRYQQVDINFKKTFRRGVHTFTGQADFFNVLNSGGILTQTDQVGASLGQPLTILQGRLPRLAFSMQW